MSSNGLPAGATSFIPVGELTRRNGHVAEHVNGHANGNTHHAYPVEELSWLKVGKSWDFPVEAGATIKYGQTQIAVFNFASRGEWYATQNMCPHRREFVLGRGIIGDQAGIPKVACPVHKKTFSLESGECLSGDDYILQTFSVKVDGDDVYLKLPAIDELDAKLATEKTCNKTCHHELQVG